MLIQIGEKADLKWDLMDFVGFFSLLTEGGHLRFFRAITPIADNSKTMNYHGLANSTKG